jgi:hypothetical protein
MLFPRTSKHAGLLQLRKTGGDEFGKIPWLTAADEVSVFYNFFIDKAGSCVLGKNGVKSALDSLLDPILPFQSVF